MAVVSITTDKYMLHYIYQQANYRRIPEVDSKVAFSLFHLRAPGQWQIDS